MAPEQARVGVKVEAPAEEPDRKRAAGKGIVNGFKNGWKKERA